MVKKIISVASIAAPKLDIYSIQNDSKIIHVYDAYLIRLLSQVFQVPYMIYLPSDGAVGANLPDGNWTGMMGMVYRSEVDVALGGILVTDSRSQALNFSYPHHFSDCTFMTDKPKPYPTSFALIYPFPIMLWVLLLAALFLFSCVFLLHVYRKQTYQNILFMLFGSLLEKSIDMQLRKLSFKLILCAWLIFAFVITNSYKAVLLSILTVPPLTGIKNIPDLAKAVDQNSVNCYSYKGAGTRNHIESEIATWRSIGKCLERNVISSQDPEESFIKYPSNKAFITSRSYLKPYEERYFISKDSFFNSMHAFSVSKKFRRLKYLDERIHRLFAAGIFQKIEKDEQFLLKLNATHSDSIEPGSLKVLQFQDLKGAFIVLFTGYAISTIVLFIEIAVKYYFPKSGVCFIKSRKKILKNI